MAVRQKCCLPRSTPTNRFAIIFNVATQPTKSMTYFTYRRTVPDTHIHRTNDSQTVIPISRYVLWYRYLPNSLSGNILFFSFGDDTVIVTHPTAAIAIRRFESVLCPHEEISGEGLVRRRLYVCRSFTFFLPLWRCYGRIFVLNKLNNIFRMI